MPHGVWGGADSSLPEGQMGRQTAKKETAVRASSCPGTLEAAVVVASGLECLTTMAYGASSTTLHYTQDARTPDPSPSFNFGLTSGVPLDAPLQRKGARRSGQSTEQTQRVA